MITEELYINGTLVDLGGASTIATTFQANQLGELQNRQADFSNTFQLPKSPTNRQVFENADIVNSSTLLPYRKLTARYVVDGIEQLQDGIAQIVRTTESAYHVQVKSGNASFFGKFPDLKVSELIGDSLDHLNTFANITASRSNTSGYIYPLIDWMQDGIETEYLTGTINAKNLLPCIFVRDIFDKVDQLTGYTSYGKLLDLPIFDNLILTPNKLERSDAAKAFYDARARVSADQSFLLGTNNGTVTFANVTPTMLDFNGNFSGATYTADAGLYGYFTFKGEIVLKYKRYEFSQRFIRVRVEIIRDSDGAVIETETLFDELTLLDPAETEVTVSLPFSLVTNNITFGAGDQYHVNIYAEDPTKSEVTYKEGVEFKFNLEAAIPYGGFMPVGELYDGITVKQVYQDVLNMFAVTPITNSFQSRVRFGLFGELLDNIPNAKDWSQKISARSNELNFTFGNYAKTNGMAYKPDDTVKQFYGDSSFTVDNENLADSVTAIQLNVSAVEDETRYQGKLYPRIKALDASRVFTETNYRLLVLDRSAASYGHTYTDGTNNLAVTTNVPYCTFRPLLFENLKAEYYPALLGLLQKTKAPAYRVKLTPQDIQELDYLTPIYLDVHDDEIDVTGYFYLNQIANYVNGFATASLVRL